MAAAAAAPAVTAAADGTADLAELIKTMLRVVRGIVFVHIAHFLVFNSLKKRHNYLFEDIDICFVALYNTSIEYCRHFYSYFGLFIILIWR